MSIAAEIVKDRWGGSGRPLAETDGEIHSGTGHPGPIEAAPLEAPLGDGVGV